MGVKREVWNRHLSKRPYPCLEVNLNWRAELEFGKGRSGNGYERALFRRNTPSPSRAPSRARSRATSCAQTYSAPRRSNPTNATIGRKPMSKEPFRQPELAAAILRELIRQNRKAAFPAQFYTTLFQVADRIVSDANSAIAGEDRGED